MQIFSSSNRAALERIINRQQAADRTIERRVGRIVDDVRRHGDRALLKYARRFDRLSGPIEVTRREMQEAAQQVPPHVRRAIRRAAAHVRRIARRQVPRGWKLSVAPGVMVEQRVTPLERVACYVPGGRYPLPSSLLMTAIPARVAGVGEVLVACPRPDATVLAAALEAGVSRLFRLGGAHVIAAFAYGTETIPKVDKIVGPGSAYVAAAKTRVWRDCAIDFYAGPTEIVIIAEDGRPDWIAADLTAQAEHDPDARAVLLTSNRQLATLVARAVEAQLPAAGPAAESIRRHGAIVVTNDLDEAIDLTNRIAPEHAVCDHAAAARKVTTAGTVFVGPFAAQAAGDYATGSNHVLPTSGAARFRGGLSAADFVRVNSVQHVSRRGLAALAPTVVSLAEAEGLTAHRASIEIRLRTSKGLRP